MLQELHIQSNLPLIVLVISFICVVVIGFLEFKKVSLRLDELTTKLNSLSLQPPVNTIQEKDLTEPIKNDDKKKGDKKKDEESPSPSKKPKMSLDGDSIMMENIMPGDAEILIGMPQPGMPPPGMPPGLASMIIGGPMMPMGEIHVQNIYEEDIVGGGVDIQEEKISEIDEDNLSEVGGELEEDIEKEDIEDKKSEYEDSSEEESDEGSDEESEEESDEESSDEEVIGKGKVEEIKDVDRSSSIRELKEICQKLGLSTSGNKETLIKRINSKK